MSRHPTRHLVRGSEMSAIVRRKAVLARNDVNDPGSRAHRWAASGSTGHRQKRLAVQRTLNGSDI
jgi:hypothetical protein